MVFEPLTPVVGLYKSVALYRGPHRTIQEKNALLEEWIYRVRFGHWINNIFHSNHTKRDGTRSLQAALSVGL